MFELAPMIFALVSSGAGADHVEILSLEARPVPRERAVEITYQVAPEGYRDGDRIPLTVLRRRVDGEGELPAPQVIFEAAVSPDASKGRIRDTGLLRNATFRYTARVRIGGREVTASAGELTVPSLFSWGRLRTLIALCAFGALFLFFVRRGRTRSVYLRRIAGIDAIEEAIGRATEMGKPVLYVPGIEDQSDIQTLASLVVLGEVGTMTTEYGVRLVVPTKHPVVMAMAQEIAQEACTAAGRPEAYVEEDVRYLSDEQFAYCAAIDGIMVRDRPAANLFMGAFWAESLILAETGFSSGAIQVAGTASVAQMPFFVVACDYTMLGEEFYAASAYLSKNPQSIAGIKAADWLKAALVVYFLGGLGLALLREATGPETAAVLGQMLEYWQQPRQLIGR